MENVFRIVLPGGDEWIVWYASKIFLFYQSECRFFVFSKSTGKKINLIEKYIGLDRRVGKKKKGIELKKFLLDWQTWAVPGEIE